MALLVWLRFIPFNMFWKLSPFLVILALLIGLFIPMGWGAPSGPAAVLRNSVQIIPEVAGEVVEVPVVANTPVKAGEVLLRIDPTTYQAQVVTIQAQLKFAEQRLGQFSELQSRDTGRALTFSSGRPRSSSCGPSSREPSGTSTRPLCGHPPTAT
jgi:hypothetical protein